jgi:Fe-S cluster assembly protein SufD
MSGLLPAGLAEGLQNQKESWKYTSLRGVLRHDWRVAEGAAPPAPGGRWTVDGRPMDGRRTVDARPTDDRWAGDGRPLTGLTVALGQQAERVQVPAGERMVIYGEHLMPVKDALAARQILLEVGAGAELVLVETLGGDGSGWAADTLRLSVGAGAVVRHAVVQAADLAATVTRSERVEVATGGRYERLALQTGAQLGRLDLVVAMERDGTARLAGVNLANAGQLLDQTTRLELAGPGNRAEVQQRNVAGTGGTVVFQGKYRVAAAAQQTDGYMLVKNLLLGEGAAALGKPELEIYADDVKCSHGASTGGLNAEQLFYLAARGVAEDAARRLLVGGFATELLSGWPGEIEAVARPAVEGWLAAA